MTQRLDVDLDSEKVMIDGNWLGRAELSARITQMISSGDYKIGRLASALEALDQALAGARIVSFKLAAENYGKLEAAGQKLGKSAAEFARDLLIQVLGSAAALPAPMPGGPVIAPGPAPVIAAADVTPEEAAVALTMKPKSREPAAAPTPTPAAVQPVAPAPAPAITQPPAPAGPQPSVVVDLGAPEDPGRPKSGERRWFNR